MKKSVFLFLFLALSALGVSAQDPKVYVTLDDDTPKRTKSFPGLCEITLTRVDGGSDDVFDVIVELESKSDLPLILFERSYTEKDLKRLKIKFPKRFYGEHRAIACKELHHDLRIAPGSDSEKICSFEVEKNSKRVVEIPVYIAKKKEPMLKFFKSKTMILQSLVKMELNITIDSKAKDLTAVKDYERIKKSCDSLLNVIRESPVCPKKKHRPSLTVQKRPFLDAASNLCDDIAYILRRDEIPSSSELYQQYQQLRKQLSPDNLPFAEQDCGGHPTPLPTTCCWCQMTLEQIYQRMDDNNVDLRSGKKSKRSLMSEMEAMYKCCSTHSSHASAWRAGGNIVRKINRLIDEFKNLR